MQEKAQPGDTVAQSTDASSPTKGENDQSHPTSPAAKSPQNKLPPPKPEPLVAAAGDQEEREGGEGTCRNLFRMWGEHRDSHLLLVNQITVFGTTMI